MFLKHPFDLYLTSTDIPNFNPSLSAVTTEFTSLFHPYSVCISLDILPFISVYGQLLPSTAWYKTPLGGQERDLGNK